MIAMSNWKLTGALILSLLRASSCTEGCIWVNGDEKHGLEQLKGDIGKVNALNLRNICLDQLLPFKLAERAPLIASVSLRSIRKPSDKHPPKNIAPCASVERLWIESSIGSLKNIRWIKALFPNVSKVFIAPGGFPIQTQKHATACREEKLAMESVKELEIAPGDCDLGFIDKIKGVSPPIFDNLALFPNLTSIVFKAMIIKPVSLDNFQPTDLVLPEVKKLDIYKLPTNPVLFAHLAPVFPSLSSMVINDSMLWELTRGDREDGSLSTLPLRNLTALTVNVCRCSPWHPELRIGAKIATVFPSLIEIELVAPGKIHLPEKGAEQLKTVESIKIYGKQDEYDSDFFKSIFPQASFQAGLKQEHVV